MRLILALSLILVSSAGSHAQNSEPIRQPFKDAQPALRLINKANEIFEKDPVAALKALEEALAFCPNDARILLDQALLKLSNRDHAGAQADVLQAYRAFPPLGQIYHLSGSIRMLNQDFYGAIQDLSVSIFIEPRRYLQYMPRAMARFSTGDYQGAVEDYSVLIESPQQAAIESVYFMRGQAHYEMGNGDRAMADLNTAIDLTKGKNPPAYYYLYRAWQHTRSNKLDAALKDCSEALRINPDSARDLNYRSWLYHRVGQTDLAHRDADAAVSLNNGTPIALLLRGALHEMEKRNDLAKADYRKSIALAETRPDRGTWLYASFSLDLLTRRTGGELAQGYLHDVLSWPDDWPKRIAIYLSGRISADSLLVDARNTKDASRRNHRECEANYYIGMIKLIDGDRDEAMDCFLKCIASGKVTLVEYRLATAHLNSRK